MKKISDSVKLNSIKNKVKNNKSLTPEDESELNNQLNTKIKKINSFLEKKA